MGDDIDLNFDFDLGDVCFCDDDCDCNCCCYDSNPADNSCLAWSVCIICISADNNSPSHRERHYHDPEWWCCCCRCCDDDHDSRKMKESKRKESEAKKEQVGIDYAESERCSFCGKNKPQPNSRCSSCLMNSKVSSALDPQEIPKPQTMASPVTQRIQPLHNEKYFMYRDWKNWYND